MSIKRRLTRDEVVKTALVANFKYGYGKMALRNPDGSVRELITYDEYKRRMY